VIHVDTQPFSGGHSVKPAGCLRVRPAVGRTEWPEKRAHTSVMAQPRQLFPEPPESSGSRNPCEPETTPATEVVPAIHLPAPREFDALLTETVQQALLTTRATGAAIALREGAEMVCRATTGGHAPDLGDQLDTKSGLSGACVQSGRVQICSDTELDPRVNVEACRSLGVRSILVAPLLQHDTLVGVMELFSPVVRSFGERDIQTLEACARRILEAMENAKDFRGSGSAREPSLEGARGEGLSHSTEQPRVSETASIVDPLPVFEPPPSLLSESVNPVEPPQRRDFVNTVLTGLVIGLAILFGSLLGSQIARHSASRSPLRATIAAPNDQLPLAATPAPEAAPADSPPVEGTQPAHAGMVHPARKVEGTGEGGLVVYQNDRVVFQLPPAPAAADKDKNREASNGPSSANGPVRLSPEVAGKLLASRVEPQYPPEAVAARIQGTVGIRLTVDRTGVVQRARVFSGPPELAQAAVDAVKQWSFKPYSPAGSPTDFETTATIDFRLP
jgi:TonB family protein